MISFFSGVSLGTLLAPQKLLSSGKNSRRPSKIKINRSDVGDGSGSTIGGLIGGGTIRLLLLGNAAESFVLRLR
jgi:hypothetical protein